MEYLINRDGIRLPFGLGLGPVDSFVPVIRPGGKRSREIRRRRRWAQQVESSRGKLKLKLHVRKGDAGRNRCIFKHGGNESRLR